MAALVTTIGAVRLHTGTEATSFSVPKFDVEFRPPIAEEPVSVILPVANGVAAVGRTWIPCHVSVFTLELDDKTVNVIAVAVMEVTLVEVPVVIPLMFLLLWLLPVAGWLLLLRC